MNAINGAVPIQQKYKDTTKITNNTQTLGKDAFMKLLVAQMQNQDPLNPMSNKDSIAQLAQFSSLEQMTALNKSFQSLSTNQKITNISAGAQFLGKEVEGLDGSDQVQGKVVGASFKDGSPILRVDVGDGSYKSIAMQDITSVSEPQ